MDPKRSSLAKYAAFFGREPDSVQGFPAEGEAKIWIARFPPKQVGFFKRMFTQLADGYVWITGGMSLSEMSIPKEKKGIWKIALN